MPKLTAPKARGAEAQTINHALDKIKAKIIEYYQQIREREGFATAEMVRNSYQGIGNKYETLLFAFDKHNADFSKQVGKDRAKGTYQKYCIVRNHLANFIGSYYKRKKTNVPFQAMLLDSAMKIIERYEPFRKGNYLFDFLSNQHANRKPKQIG
jgi:hypothetical protein